MNGNVLLAVFRRNFVSYFLNPTGYLFIFLFALLGSVAAFGDAFFAANLANLDQLTRVFPWIMLLFVPAITMGMWAEERRQSTDELLLTIPASDADVVLGKYLAGVAIFAVSLAFSFSCNILVLLSLGSPDLLLIFCNYFGYFMVGLAMLAIGMVASFLTSHLTVAWVLGALLNVPLVALAYADKYVPWSATALWLKQWSIGYNLAPFGRGEVTLGTMVYFLSVAAVMTYLSIVLVGRRHWLGGRDGHAMLGHYLLRCAALLVVALGLTYLSSAVNVSADLTTDRLNTFHRQSIELVKGQQPEQPVQIEAFISPNVPEAYVPTKLKLVSTLHRLGSMAGNIDVEIYDTAPYSEAAKTAEKVHGIERHTVASKQRGADVQEDIYMGVVMRSGTKKVVIPFVGLALPVEYEMVRSLSTIVEPARKRLGIVTTDAALMGGLGSPEQLIVNELRRQYEVVEVDPSDKIVDPDDPDKKELDVLLCVQPSSLSPEQLPNLLDAIRSGVPTAIFEDPFPFWMTSAPGTSQPKRPPQHMFMMQPQGPQPKCDIQRLWDLLGVRMTGERKASEGGFPPTLDQFDALVVWQKHNPYPKLRQLMGLTNQWVFVNPDAPGAQTPFTEDSPITAGLHELLLLFPGAISKADLPADSALKFLPLVTTGTATGTVRYDDIRESLSRGSMFERREPDYIELQAREFPTESRYTLAARITGELPAREIADLKSARQQAETEAKADKNGTANEKSKHTLGQVDVVLTMDIDLMESFFVQLRSEPMRDLEELQFQNVAYVLNVIDALAGDDRFLTIRAKDQSYRRLSKVEARLNAIREGINEQIESYREAYRTAEKENEKQKKQQLEKLEDEIQEIQDEINSLSGPDRYRKLPEYEKKAQNAAIRRIAQTQAIERREAVDKLRLKRERDDAIAQKNDELEQMTRETQDRYKALAIALPPLPPLLLALVVFLARKVRETEGVSRKRMV